MQAAVGNPAKLLVSSFHYQPLALSGVSDHLSNCGIVGRRSHLRQLVIDAADPVVLRPIRRNVDPAGKLLLYVTFKFLHASFVDLEISHSVPSELITSTTLGRSAQMYGFDMRRVHSMIRPATLGGWWRAE